MAKKIVIEAATMVEPQKTGIGYFSQHLAQGLEQASARHNFTLSYLLINLFSHKRLNSPLLQAAASQGRLQMIRWFSHRVYAKLVFLKLPLPLSFGSYDIAIFPNFYSWPLPRTKKTVIVVHDLSFRRLPHTVEHKNVTFLRSVVGQSVRRADGIITVSEFTKQELISFYPHLSADKILAVDIPVPPDRFDPAKSAPEKLQKFGLTGGYILCVGTIEPRKNIGALIKAYSLLPPAIQRSFPLVIAGKWGWNTDSIRSEVEAARAKGLSIITPGYISDDDMENLYLNASICTIPSMYEGFGMPLLEAMAAGSPVVANDIPVFREVGQDACNFTDADNPQAFAATLEQTLTDAQLRQILIEKGRLRVREFSWDTTTTKIIDWLEAL